MTTARLFLSHCLIWLLTLASPAGAGHFIAADLQKGIAQSIFAGLQEGEPKQQPGQSDEDYAAVYAAWKNDVAGQAKLLGAVVGYTTSGGQAVNVSNAASIAESGARHNYLNHTQRARVEKLIDELNSCRVTRDCSLAEHDAMVTELRQLQDVSSQQTIAMLAACENGPSPACAAHVAAAAEFEEWAWHSAYNDLGRVVGFTPSMFQARTAGAGYDLDNDVNLDLIALELARGIQSGTLAPDVAAAQLLAALQRQDGGMKVLGGVGQTLSAGACFVTKLTCVLGLANAAVGVDRTYEGTVTLISGENQLSAIEAGLVATGYSATEAEALRDDIEAGVAIVTVGVGGAYFVYRGGIAVAQLGKVEGLPGAGAANNGRPPVTNPTQLQLDRANELGVDPRWVNSDGSIIWPTRETSGFDGGFDGPPTITEIQPGTRFDRYGGRFENGQFVDTGDFVAPSGVPFEQRSLPASSISRPYQEYEVIQPIPNVNSGTAAPWFGQPGGGTQYQLPMSIDDLVQQGFIKPVFD